MPDSDFLPIKSAIYCGDAFSLLKRVPPASVRLVLTDPPYEVSQDNNFTTMGRRGIDFGSWDHQFDQIGWLQDAVTALLPGGSLIIWNDWKLLGPIALHLQDTLGLSVKRMLTWRKCLSGATRVYAKTFRGDGAHMIKDLAKLDPASVQLWTGSTWSQVVSWERQPHPESPLEIEFRSGEIVRCTDDHRWPTQRGLLEARELVVGDVIQTVTLPEPEPRVSPTALDDEMVGWFVGLYIAEGSRGGHKRRPKLQFAGHIEEDARHLRLQQIADNFHGTLSVHNTHGKAVSANITGSVLHGIIDHYVRGHDCYDKHLSRKVWERSNTFLRAVLLGYLDGDGHYDAKNDRYRLGFTGKNKHLANDLRTLCARLGFNLRLRRRRAMCAGKVFPAYKGEIRLTTSSSCKPNAEVVSVRPCRWPKDFWDVAIEDAPHLFALASGILTHNSNPFPRNIARLPVQGAEYALWAVKPGKEKWVFNRRPGLPYDRGEFEYPVVRKSVHPTKKPDALFQDLIQMFSNPGELVLDPFAGAGTTAVAAQRCGRLHISFELDPTFFALANDALAQA